MLSGSNKTNADTVVQPHNHHPLSERSHNTLHMSSSTITAQSQAANTPKRNLNQLGNTINQLHNNPNLQVESHENSSRGRRNLSNDATFNTPPDVLNTNALINNAPLNIEECSNRVNHSVNLNINRAMGLDSESASSELNANNLNTPRSCAQKKKSSSKLPAKNSSNTGNFSVESLHNKNIQTPNNESENADHNLACSSKPKSTAKLFDLLRENVYSEVSALISANESRPHFLIQLFRDLQQISSDTLRQRTLESIQEVVTRYLSTVEVESLAISEDNKNLHRVSSSNDDQICHGNTNGEIGIFNIDTNNEIIRFIIAHHADPCSNELFQSLRAIIYSITKNVPKKIEENLLDCFNRYPESKLMDIGDELIVIISGIMSDVNKTTARVVNSNEAMSNSVNTLDDQINSNMCSGSNDDEHHHSMVDKVESNYDTAELPSCSNSLIMDINPGNSACSSSYNVNPNELKIDLIESVETCNGDLAEADQSRHGSEPVNSAGNVAFENLPDIVDMDEQTPTEVYFHLKY